jgi:sulfite exporter TauE/SafE
MGYLGFLNRIEVSFSKRPWYGKLFGKLLKSHSIGSFYALGMLNGIIPCGLVYSFAVIAAGTASPVYGGLVMLVFGLSTVPTLFILGHITDYLRRGKIKNIMMRLSAVLVILYGVYTIYKGYKFIRYPEQMKKMMEQMHQPAPQGQKCGGMKCGPGKCG